MFKLSIITINYNNKPGLQKTIDSVIAQNYKKFEYIVIDGGSTDQSIDVIKQNESHISYWVSEKDSGIYDAINKGISNASGKYCMFLNSGDCLANSAILNLCNEYIIKFDNTDIFYGDIMGNDEVLNTSWVHKHPEKLDLAFFQHDNINHQASLIKADLFKEIGYYTSEYKLAGDHWFYLKCIIENKVFTHIDCPMVIYDYNGKSMQNRALYDAEMDSIWELLVPKYAETLTNMVNDFRYIMHYKIVKAAIVLNSKIQKIRRK